MIVPPPTSSRSARRQLALLKHAGLFGEDTKGAIIRRAFTARDLRNAYRLVHDVFVGTGFMRPEPSGIRLRMFETLSETATFIAEKDGAVVGVLSVVGDSPDLGLPSDAAFKDELDALRRTGARICELTNQAVAEEYRKSAVATELMRCAIAHGMNAGYDASVATVSPGHNGFYQLLGFCGLGSERSYSQKLHDPVVAMTLDLDFYRNSAPGVGEIRQFLHQHGRADNPYLDQVCGWTSKASSYFGQSELLQELFVDDRNFLAECSAKELKLLEQRWGREAFNSVASASLIALREEATTIPARQSDDSTVPFPFDREPGLNFGLQAAFG